MAAREREVVPVGAEVLGTAQDRAGRQEAGKAFETSLPEQKWKEKMADTVVAAGESKKMMSASAPSRLTASAAIKRPVIDMKIQVRDTYSAVREIEARLGQFNLIIPRSLLRVISVC
jgi:hypothetical protein